MNVVLRLLVVTSSIVLSAACSATPAGSQTPSPSLAPVTSIPTAPPTPSLTPTPTPAPTLNATTVPGGQAPEDAVLVEIFECCTFQPYAVTVAAGTVSFLVKNEDGEPHNLNIGTQRWASMAATGTLGAGDSEALVIDALESGQYIFWCSINGHMNFGMSGTVTVE